jgi:hypothetical protein
VPRPDDWEVCFYSDVGDYEVWSKFLPSHRRARRLMLRTFKNNNSYYCATISNDRRAAFQIYYWNGRRLIAWDKPWVLSRRQAVCLDIDDNGRAVLNGSNREWKL